MAKKKPAKTGKKSHIQVGSLGLVAAFFIASGLLRIAGPVSEAIAAEAAKKPVETASVATPAACEIDQPLPEIIAELKARKAELDARETKLLEYEQSLKIAEKAVLAKLDELQVAERNLAEKIALSAEAAESDLARLTAVYENMKPQVASALFEKMDPEFAAGFLGRMRPDAAALIMAGLTPENAYTISVILAGRNVEAPTQ